MSLPLPPAAGTSGVSFVTEISHLLPVGPTTLVLPDRHATTPTTVATRAAETQARRRTARGIGGSLDSDPAMQIE
jgi:hypothetical protein